MASLTVENYLKAIYLIVSRDDATTSKGQKIATTGEIASAMNVSPSTVTGMVKTLTESKLTAHTPYGGVRLTDAGLKVAVRVLRRHRLIELFLVKTLSLSWDEVHEEAENMEHSVSDRLIDKIDAYLGRPQTDPHGDPIPQADGTIPKLAGQPLSQLSQNQHFQIVRVLDQDPAFLRYLTENQLEIGSTGKVLDNRQESGAITLRVNDKNQAMSLDAASKVLVVDVSSRFDNLDNFDKETRRQGDKETRKQ